MKTNSKTPTPKSGKISAKTEEEIAENAITALCANAQRLQKKVKNLLADISAKESAAPHKGSIYKFSADSLAEKKELRRKIRAIRNDFCNSFSTERKNENKEQLAEVFCKFVDSVYISPNGELLETISNAKNPQEREALGEMFQKYYKK
jgi:hypothetical protein